MSTETTLPIPSKELVDSITSYKLLRLNSDTTSEKKPVSFVVYTYTDARIVHGWVQINKKVERLSTEQGDNLVSFSRALVASSLSFEPGLRFVNVQFQEKKIISVVDPEKDLVVVCEIQGTI
jgi:hypothetical protein